MKRTTVWCGSHIPLLIKLMPKVNLPILELGMGWNSTPLLHWLAKEKGLFIYSFESDPEWIKFFEEYKDEGHSVNLTNFENTFPGNYGLVFIDHRPAYKRKYSALKYKDTADYIVLHDSEQGKPYSYDKIIDQFEDHFEYKSVGKPYTLVLSNRKSLTWLKNSISAV